MITAQEKQTRKAYKTLAKTWATLHSDTTFWKKYYRIFQKYLPAGKILDIGCGAGRDARFFIDAGYKYLGVDASPEMLVEAKRLYPKVIFKKMDMTDLEFPVNNFDGFWAYASFLHIPKNKISGILQRIRTVVKRGGIGSIAIKEGEGETMVPGIERGTDRFFAFYKQDEFAHILLENKFKILEQRCDLRVNKITGISTMWLVYFVKI